MYLASKLDRIVLELHLIAVTAALHAGSSRQNRVRTALVKRRLLKPQHRKTPAGQLVLQRYLQFMDSLRPQ